MNPIAQRLRSLAARTALDGIAEEMRAIADELAQQAQEPWGWTIEDKRGVAQVIRPSRGGFFGCIQATGPFTVEDVEKMGREWSGLAPRRIVKLYTTPPAPQPAPVDELIEALEDLMDWQVKNVKSWHNRAYDRAYRAIKKHRATHQPTKEAEKSP